MEQREARQVAGRLAITYPFSPKSSVQREWSALTGSPIIHPFHTNLGTYQVTRELAKSSNQRMRQLLFL